MGRIKEERKMLKLTVKPGEYIDIGEDIRVIFTGGSANNLHILVDAPREKNIVRSQVLKKNEKETSTYKKDADISPEAKAKIKKILAQERYENKKKEKHSSLEG